MKKRTRIAALVVVIVVLAAFLGVRLAVNPWVKGKVERTGTAMTGVRVTLFKAEVEPIKGRGELRDLAVANPAPFQASTAFRVGRIHFDVEPQSVFADHLVVNELRLENVLVNFERDDARSNLDAIGEALATYAAAHPSDQQVTIRRFALTRVRIKLHGPDIDPQLQELVLDPVELEGLSGSAEAVGEAIAGAVMAEISSEVAESLSLMERTKRVARATVESVRNGVIGLLLDVKDLFVGGEADPATAEPDTNREEEP